MLRQFLFAALLPNLALIGAAVQAQDLDALPHYRAESRVAGTIRMFGSDLAGQILAWEKGFAKFHPGVRFVNRFPSSDGAVGGMISKVADLGPSGRELVLTEYLMFNETFGYDPEQIAVATGAFDRAGRSWAPVIYVHRDNPIRQLTLQQLDGIFGAQRSGGYQGLKWMPQNARGPELNIRSWGDLGLTGEWADKPIQTYGYALTGMSNFFQLKVFHGGDKWNPNYRQFVETGTKMVAEGPVGATGGIRHMLTEELAKNRYGIAWTGIPQAVGVPELKILALAAQPGGSYVLPTRETVMDRSYPLARSVFIYINRAPGKRLLAPQREFLRYVLSREGQKEVLRNGNYLPLTPAFVDEERRKLDGP
ncbi:MAG: phosphate ABC transporter substrate-binding protein [Pseudomonadota bacterium]|nr:phosphate ABC transporter substrate-binding protein [Pseudomonadota bacterium]